MMYPKVEKFSFRKPELSGMDYKISAQVSSFRRLIMIDNTNGWIGNTNGKSTLISSAHCSVIQDHCRE